jgi:hypothetical protein
MAPPDGASPCRSPLIPCFASGRLFRQQQQQQQRRQATGDHCCVTHESESAACTSSRICIHQPSINQPSNHTTVHPRHLISFGLITPRPPSRLDLNQVLGILDTHFCPHRHSFTQAAFHLQRAPNRFYLFLLTQPASPRLQRPASQSISRNTIPDQIADQSLPLSAPRLITTTRLLDRNYLFLSCHDTASKHTYESRLSSL